MANNSNILVSTTSTLEGITIESYLKPVSAHIVVGANVLSDILSSFTDFFGGYSDSLQKRLSLIYEDGLKAIREKAANIGADAVIGLSVDLDEISGKGKSMFMVTVIGTAVKIKSEDHGKINTIKVQSGEISGQEMAVMIKKKALIKEISTYQFIDSTIWDFAIENNIYEIFEPLINSASLEFKNTSTFPEKVMIYLQNIPEEIAADNLYASFLNPKISNISSKIFEVINTRGIRSYSKLIDIMNQSEMPSREKVLRLAGVNNSIYKKEDIEQLQKLHDLIEVKYPVKAEFTSRKKLLSNTEEEIWVCGCKTKNQVKIKYCSSCGLDVFGFSQAYPNVENLKNRLVDTIEILKSILS